MKNIHESYDTLVKELNSAEDEESREKILAKRREKYYTDLESSFRECTQHDFSKKVLREIFNWTGIFNSVTVKEESIIHAEGRRLIGFMLKQKLDEIDPELFFNLMKEGIRYEKGLFEL